MNRYFVIVTLCLLPNLATAQFSPPVLVSLEETGGIGIDRSGVRSVSEAECCLRSTLMIWNSSVEPAGGPPGWDEPLASDRPDFTEASCTVGRGVCQLEVGFTYLQDDDGVSRTAAHSYPETLLRMGVLADWLELRVGWNYANEALTTGGARTHFAGAEDLYLGAKIGLTPQQGILPEMALMPQMTVPLGSVFSSNRVLPGVNWLYGWDINEFLSTAGSTQLNLSVDGATDAEYVEFAQSWTIGYSLTDRVGAYTEWFVLAPCSADTALTEHYFNGGFTYRVTNNLQLDIRAGTGLNAAAADFFTGLGAVSRF